MRSRVLFQREGTPQPTYGVLLSHNPSQEHKPEHSYAGFIDGDKDAMLKITGAAVSEELLYACRFGLDYVTNVDTSTPNDKFAELL